MLLQAIDRVTGPAKRIQASMAGIGKASKKLGGDLGVSSKAYDRGYALGNKLRGGLDRLAGGFARVGRMAKLMAAAGVNSFGAAAERAGRATGRLIKKMGGMAVNAAKWGAAGAVAFGGYALFDMFRVASDMEQVTAELAEIAGSAAKAKEEMAWLQSQQIAVPIRDLAAAYVQLRRGGIDPTSESLRRIADEAAQSKKPITDIVDALKEAKAGDFGGLISQNIKTAVKNGVVTFTWLDKEGKRASRSVKNSAKQIERAMLDIFDNKSGGASKRFASTFAGMMQSIRDQWVRFELMVANAGIFDKVKAKLQEWLDKIGVLAKDGRLKAWAEKISKFLGEMWDRAVKFIEDTDWNAVTADLKKVGEAVLAIADGILAITKYWGIFSGAVRTTARIMDPMNAAGAMIQGGKGMITGDPIGGMKKGLGIFLDVPPGKPGGAPKPAGPVGTLPSNFMRPKIGMNDNRVGGAVRVIIEPRGDISARTASIKSDNARVPVIVNTGRTMAGAA